jgi:hypothetical protein
MAQRAANRMHENCASSPTRSSGGDSSVTSPQYALIQFSALLVDGKKLATMTKSSQARMRHSRLGQSRVCLINWKNTSSRSPTEPATVRTSLSESAGEPACCVEIAPV